MLYVTIQIFILSHHIPYLIYCHAIRHQYYIESNYKSEWSCDLKDMYDILSSRHEEVEDV